jgi:hypothetical protein
VESWKVGKLGVGKLKVRKWKVGKDKVPQIIVEKEMTNIYILK